MTQKEIYKLLSNTKVYVNGKGEEIQNKLIKLGCKWISGNNKVQYLDSPFLFINSDLLITHDHSMIWFTQSEKREITAEEILSLELTEPTYRPFKDKEECWQEMLKHEPFEWVKRIDTGYFANIAVVSDYSIMFNGGLEYFYDIALKEYTFADGSPFGIKEE